MNRKLVRSKAKMDMLGMMWHAFDDGWCAHDARYVRDGDVGDHGGEDDDVDDVCW